jgi:hypothetical protein
LRSWKRRAANSNRRTLDQTAIGWKCLIAAKLFDREKLEQLIRISRDAGFAGRLRESGCGRMATLAGNRPRGAADA